MINLVKNISLYIYELDDDGGIINFETTNMNTPNNNCLSVLIDLKESMQIEKLRVITDEVIPRIEHKEQLLNIKETEFGWELTDEVIVTPIKNEKELKREALLKQLAELDSQPSE